MMNHQLYGNGTIDNVRIENNDFYIHEEKVDNPSWMNFSFGNGGSSSGIIKNISFSYNTVNSESIGTIFTCLGEEGSENISINNNTIKWKHLGNDISYSGIIENLYTTNLKVANNQIECTSQEGSTGYLYKFAENAEFYDNILNINLGLASLSSDNSTSIFKNNIINFNSDIDFIYEGYEFTNNTVNINGKIGTINKTTPVLFRFYGKTINKDVKIIDNTISINSTNTCPTSIFFMFNSYINNYNINFSNNIINSTTETNTKELIHLQYMNDLVSQKIYLNNNISNIFKQIYFLNNKMNPTVIVNGKEINTNTTLE